MVARASNDSIWFSTFNSTGAFNNDWVNIPGRTVSPPGMAYVSTAGYLAIVVRASDNSIWEMLSSCASISPASISYDWTGGTGSVNVVAPSTCNWTATSHASWITITSGTSGSGNGTVYYSVSANPGPNSRTGTLTIAGQTFTVTQAAPSCTYTLSVSTNPSSGGTVNINPQQSTYCAGDVVTLTAIPHPGYTFSSWSGVDSSNGSAATVTMNGNRTVTANFISCSGTYTILPAGQNFGSGGGTGSVSVTAGSGCSWTATSNASWITITSGTSGSGNGTVNYSVSANTSPNARTGTLTIAGLPFNVMQIGIKPPL